MGLSLQFIVVFFALAASFSLSFASHYHDGKRIDELEIKGEFYCSSDGNKQSSSTRKLSRAKISLSCDNGKTIVYETTTKSDGEFKIELEDEHQTIIDYILDKVGFCALLVHLPAEGCLLAPSNGYFQAYLDQPNVKNSGSHVHFKVLPSTFVSCL